MIADSFLVPLTWHPVLQCIAVVATVKIVWLSVNLRIAMSSCRPISCQEMAFWVSLSTADFRRRLCDSVLDNPESQERRCWYETQCCMQQSVRSRRQRRRLVSDSETLFVWRTSRAHDAVSCSTGTHRSCPAEAGQTDGRLSAMVGE